MNPGITKLFRPVAALALALGLSACASSDSVESTLKFTPATRAAAPAAALTAPAEAAPAVAEVSSYKVVRVNVTVPETLRVSEANRYYPGGDIVWREDPAGNRYQQVKTIVEAGLNKGIAGLKGDRAVVLDVQVTRFHALTEKARYTVGGVHAIQFLLQIRDAKTGKVLVAPHKIKADFDALGGSAAVAAESRGVTQRVRITNHLAYVIQKELSAADGYVARDNGLMGAINQL